MDIRMAPKFAINNREKLEKVSECACYHCLKVFVPGEIEEWVDQNNTAICPYCAVDAVFPVYEEGDKNTELLAKIHEYWF